MLKENFVCQLAIKQNVTDKQFNFLIQPFHETRNVI